MPTFSNLLHMQLLRNTGSFCGTKNSPRAGAIKFTAADVARNYARLWPDEADGEPSKKEEEAEVEEEENAHGGAEAEEHFAMPDLFD